MWIFFLFHLRLTFLEVYMDNLVHINLIEFLGVSFQCLAGKIVEFPICLALKNRTVL